MSVPLDTSSTLQTLVKLVLMDVMNVLQLLIVKDVLLLSFSKEPLAKSAVMMDLLPSVMFVKDAQLDVLNVLKILSAIIVLITSICIRVNATLSALLELLEIDQVEIGFVHLAIPLARLA